MSATNIQAAFPTTDLHLEFAYDEPSRSSAVLTILTDPGVDDPVNDTGLGSRRGDLQLSDEFNCLIRLICEGSGDFS